MSSVVFDYYEGRPRCLTLRGPQLHWFGSRVGTRLSEISLMAGTDESRHDIHENRKCSCLPYLTDFLRRRGNQP
jgi:hypothetical protein